MSFGFNVILKKGEIAPLIKLEPNFFFDKENTTHFFKKQQEKTRHVLCFKLL